MRQLSIKHRLQKESEENPSCLSENVYFLSRQTEYISEFIGNLFPRSPKSPAENIFLFVYSISTCFISATLVNCGLVLLEFSIVLNVDLWLFEWRDEKAFSENALNDSCCMQFEVSARFEVIVHSTL